MDLYACVKPTVLVVDGSPVKLSLIGEMLHQQYTVKAVNRRCHAGEVIGDEQPDLILLGVRSLDDGAVEFCRSVKADTHTRQIPLLLLISEVPCVAPGLDWENGVADYISDPINPAILRSRIKAHLAAASREKAERLSQDKLTFEIARRTRQMLAMQDATILALASLAELRDQETGNHLRRTQHYMRALTQHLRNHARFRDFLSDEMETTLYKCAPLHDIGKVGIPDRILLKPGRLDTAEFDVMKTHPTLGFNALGVARVGGDHRVDFIEVAKQIIHCHHEKWDGSGYPQGLAGTAIPVPARLMALIDVYDALISRRVYKQGLAYEHAAEIIVQGRGRHFDPDLVDAFLSVEPEFRRIAARFADVADGQSQDLNA